MNQRLQPERNYAFRFHHGSLCLSVSLCGSFSVSLYLSVCLSVYTMHSCTFLGRVLVVVVGALEVIVCFIGTNIFGSFNLWQLACKRCVHCVKTSVEDDNFLREGWGCVNLRFLFNLRVCTFWFDTEKTLLKVILGLHLVYADWEKGAYV